MKESIYLLVRRLAGLQTVKTVQKELGVSRQTAVKKIHFLRKAGFVKTSGGGKQPRFYRITLVPHREIGSPGLFEVINKYSLVKLVEPYKHRVVGRKLTVEEALVRAASTDDSKTILASLALFNHVTNWSRLYSYAKKFGVRKRIGALYDVARETIKARRMDTRIRNKLLASKDNFTEKKLKPKDFALIQKRWNVSIPFNKADLRRYKE